MQYFSMFHDSLKANMPSVLTKCVYMLYHQCNFQCKIYKKLILFYTLYNNVYRKLCVKLYSVISFKNFLFQQRKLSKEIFSLGNEGNEVLSQTCYTYIYYYLASVFSRYSGECSDWLTCQLKGPKTNQKD